MDNITKTRIEIMLPLLDERQRRLYLAAEAQSMGRGGIKAVHELTGVSKTTIISGQKELQTAANRDAGGVRRKGGGRKPVTRKYTNIKEEVAKILEYSTFGNPQDVIWWTSKSLRNIQKELCVKGIEVSHDTIGNLLKEMG
jgi:transposase